MEKLLLFFKVKTQDYNVDKINKSMKFLWDHEYFKGKFTLLNGKGIEYGSGDTIDTKVIFLVPPSKKIEPVIKNKYIFFGDIFKDLGKDFNIDKLIMDITEVARIDVDIISFGQISSNN